VGKQTTAQTTEESSIYNLSVVIQRLLILRLCSVPVQSAVTTQKRRQIEGKMRKKGKREGYDRRELRKGRRK